MSRWCTRAAAVAAFWWSAAWSLCGPARAVDDPMRLELSAPITTWDEAVPLGNGLLGGLLWGEGDTIRLSLDRGDLWDERPAKNMPWNEFTYANLQRLVKEKKAAEINAIFDKNYSDVHPTKIPAGRLEMTLAPPEQVKRFELNLKNACGRAWLEDGKGMEVFFCAAAPHVGSVSDPSNSTAQNAGRAAR